MAEILQFLVPGRDHAQNDPRGQSGETVSVPGMIRSEGTIPNRREVLALAGGATAAIMSNRAVAAAQSKLSDLVLMDGHQLSQAIGAKRVSCAEVMTAYLDHIAQFNP